jgi:SNF2 family DNA or RNA helicase
MPLQLLPNRGKLLVKGAPRSVGSLPGARWNGNHQGYELSLTLDTLTLVRETLGLTGAQIRPAVHPDLMRWVQAARASADEAAAALARVQRGDFINFPWTDNVGDAQHRLRPPFRHQQVMATFAYLVDGAAFFCEMRTGKTRSYIEAASQKARDGDVDHLFIVCPTRVVGTWERELMTWSSEFTPVRLDQSLAERCRLIERLGADTTHKYAFITNYEGLARLADTVIALMRSRKIGFNADEAHKIKNPTAQMTKAAIKIARKAPWRVVMTGTPVTNGGEDLWSQMYVTDMGVTFGPNFVAYRDEFFVQNQWSHQTSMRGGAESTINARLQRRALRYRQADCFDMPENLYTVIPVTMTEEQRRAYNQMEQQFVAQITGTLSPLETDDDGNPIESDGVPGGMSVASIVLTQYLRLSQITSGFLPLDDGGGVHYFEPNPKLAVCEDEVRQRVEDGRSVIVWAWYKPDVAALRQRFADLHPAFIVGGMAARDTDAAQDAFQSGRTKLLIGNPGSGGMGIQLSAADTAIYYSQSFNLEHRSQSEARNQMPTSVVNRPSLTYLDLNVPNSIDEVIRNRLITKQSLADTLIEVRRRLGI